MRYIRLSAVLLLLACGDGEPTAPPTPVATSVTLSATTLSFASLGETQQLTATVKDQNGATMSGASVTWSSSSAPVATVSSAGLVTSVADGTATITATSGSASATAAVTVTHVESVSGGWRHTCGVLTTGAAYCWGGSSSTPALVSGGHTWASIATGSAHICGVTTASEAYCWTGNNTPVLVSGGHTWTLIDIGIMEANQTEEVCGVTTTGAGYCWRAGSSTPVLVSGGHTWASINPGWQHTCGVTTAGVGYCWGANDFGSLGGSGSTSQPVSGGHAWASIHGGNDRTCGLTTAGVAYCWGRNNGGHLGGSGSTSQPVSGGHTFASITGEDHHCGVTTAGEAYCWGINNESDLAGRLGNGSTSYSGVPVLVTGGHTWASISAGFWHTCGVTTAGVGYCWGGNGSAELGDGTTTNRSTPTKVSSPLNQS